MDDEESYEGWPEEWDQADKQRFDEWFSNYRKEKHTMEEDKVIVDELAEGTKENDDVLKALQEALKGFTQVFGGYMAKLPTNKPSKHQMSKRGATHAHSATFKSRQILPMTPAQYRQFHFGASQKETK